MKRKLFGITLLLFVNCSLTIANPVVNSIVADQKNLNSPEVADSNSLSMDTPRKSISNLIVALENQDYKQATLHFHLYRINKSKRSEIGKELAKKLEVIIRRKLILNLDDISNEKKGNLDDGLEKDIEKVTEVQTQKGKVGIYLRRFVFKDGISRWKISAQTVGVIPRLYKEFNYGKIEKFLPSIFFEKGPMNLQLWEWMGIIFFAIISYLMALIFSKILLIGISKVFKWKLKTLREKFIKTITRSFRFLIFVSLLSLAPLFLDYSVVALNFFNGLISGLLLLAVTWIGFKIIDLITEKYSRRFSEKKQKEALSTLPLLGRGVKFFVGILVLLVFLQNIGINITAMLAGLGIGALAIAFAGQKTLENLFGGISIVFDRPIRVGDFCKFDNLMGTVEDIGLRSTKVRTLEQTIVTVPNGDFSQMKIENFGKRTMIRFHAILNLRYDTSPDQMKLILIELKELLISHPKVNNNPARVRFVALGSHSLDVEIHSYIVTDDYDEYLAIKEDLFLRIMDIITNNGSDFAYPSQTLFMERGEKVSSFKKEEASEMIKKMVDENNLQFPDFSKEHIGKINGSIIYPPKGSTSNS